jgi:hypothetical protein
MGTLKYADSKSVTVTQAPWGMIALRCCGVTNLNFGALMNTFKAFILNIRRRDPSFFGTKK